jgi:hypothetical protein
MNAIIDRFRFVDLRVSVEKGLMRVVEVYIRVAIGFEVESVLRNRIFRFELRVCDEQR